MHQLEQKLHYQFKNKQLLQKALTHKSAGKNNNERLEFLGDSVLSIVISVWLYRRFLHLDEGTLTRLRAQLVNGKTLCALAQELELSQFLNLGKAMLNTGSQQCSVLENALEALLGAIFLDSSFDSAQQVALNIYQSRLEQLTPIITKDAKTLLQEYCQSKKLALPKYELLNTSGKDHCAVFKVECRLEDLKLTTVQQAFSIKAAQQKCAQAIYAKI